MTPQSAGRESTDLHLHLHYIYTDMKSNHLEGERFCPRAYSNNLKTPSEGDAHFYFYTLRKWK